MYTVDAMNRQRRLWHIIHFYSSAHSAVYTFILLPVKVKVTVSVFL